MSFSYLFQNCFFTSKNMNILFLIFLHTVSTKRRGARTRTPRKRIARGCPRELKCTDITDMAVRVQSEIREDCFKLGIDISNSKYNLNKG